MECRNEWPSAFKILVEMRDVGGHDDPPARGMYANKLESRRMSADGVKGNPGRELARPVIKKDTLRKIQAHNSTNIFYLK